MFIVITRLNGKLLFNSNRFLVISQALSNENRETEIVVSCFTRVKRKMTVNRKRLAMSMKIE